MTYPAGVTTRAIAFEPVGKIESGVPLRLEAVTRASRSLVWLATGQEFFPAGAEVRTDIGAGEVLALLPTDLTGWVDPVTGDVVDPAVGPTHTYVTTVWVYDENGQVGEPYTVEGYELPSGSAPVPWAMIRNLGLAPTALSNGAQIIPLADGQEFPPATPVGAWGITVNGNESLDLFQRTEAGKVLFTSVEIPAGPPGQDGVDGQDGTDGTDGEDGGQGEPGADAYEVAVENGYTGTRTQWLASLVGAPGADPTPQSYADALTANGPARNAVAGIAEQVVVDARTDVVEWQGGVEYAPGKRVVRLGRLWERKTTGSSSSFVPADWRYIGRVAGGWGNTAVLLGNSRFALERTPDGIGIGSAQQRGAMYWANLFLGQRLNIVNYAGVSGDTLDGMAARWATAVAAYVPDMVFLRDAVNDITNNASLTTVQSRYLALFALNRSIGARTIVFTTNPRNANDTARNAVIANVNRWLQSQTASDLLVIDVTTPIMATGSAQWGTNFATDGLHQSRRGAAREGRRVAKALESIIPPRPVLPTIPSDTDANLIVNSYCAGTVGTGVPASYSVSPSQGSGVTYSMVAPTDQAPGNWLQSDTGSTATAVYISQKQPIGTWVTPGSSYVRGVVEMESTTWTATLGGQGDVGVRVYLQCLDAANQPISFRSAGEYYYGSQVGDTGDATAYPLENQPGIDRTVVFETIPLLVPVGTTQLNLLTHSTVAGKVRWRGFAILKA